MKRILLTLALGAACIGAAGCEGTYYGADGGHHRLYAYEHSPVGYDGFYDNYYGSFYDGYWGDGGFYYSTGEGHPYVLDNGNHFRRESVDGFSPFHGGMHRGGR